MQREVLPVDSQRPCHLTSDPQCVHEEMDSDILPRVEGRDPVTPGLLTAPDGQLLQPPTLLPWEIEVYGSSREHWSHTCLCAGVLVVPDTEGEKE